VVRHKSGQRSARGEQGKREEPRSTSPGQRSPQKCTHLDGVGRLHRHPASTRITMRAQESQRGQRGAAAHPPLSRSQVTGHGQHPGAEAPTIHPAMAQPACLAIVAGPGPLAAGAHAATAAACTHTCPCTCSALPPVVRRIPVHDGEVVRLQTALGELDVGENKLGLDHPPDDLLCGRRGGRGREEGGGVPGGQAARRARREEAGSTHRAGGTRQEPRISPLGGEGQLFRHTERARSCTLRAAAASATMGTPPQPPTSGGAARLTAISSPGISTTPLQTAILEVGGGAPEVDIARARRCWELGADGRLPPAEEKSAAAAGQEGSGAHKLMSWLPLSGARLV